LFIKIDKKHIWP